MGRSLIVSSSATPVITASSYTTGKALGGLLTFTGIAAFGWTKLLTAVITDLANQKIAMDLMLFNQTFTATADTSTIAISGADVVKAVGVISFVAGDYISAAASTNAIATKYNLQLGAIAALDQNLYGQLVIRGSATYASISDIKVTLTAQLDQG